MVATLGQLVKESRCRKGPATGTTRRGAYWLACPPITLRRCGGDGIGNSGSEVTYTLELRHYRSGEVRCMVVRAAWHENTGSHTWLESVPSLATAQTIEQVICGLKGTSISGSEWDDWREHVFSDYYTDVLTSALAALGMPQAEQSPDE